MIRHARSRVAAFSPTRACPGICANGRWTTGANTAGPGGDDDLLEVDRLAGRGLVRFYTEAGNGSMHVDVPEETARSVARWILDHTNV